MKLKNVLCMAVVSAAVALTGVPVSGTAMVVHAEESQISNLDEILKQMYALYTNGDYASMYTLDASDMTKTYVDAVKNSGSDRYVIDLDGNTKAMIYVAPNGGWWWYFGQMENNLRQGNGTTIILASELHEIFTGNYIADFPNGEGKYSVLWNDGTGYEISGTFQETPFLNGTYQVHAAWLSDELEWLSSDLLITYANNQIFSVDGWDLDLDGWDEEDIVNNELVSYSVYYFYNEYTDIPISFVPSIGYDLFAVGMNIEGSGYWWGKSSEIINEGLSILKGNSAASAYTSSETPAAPTPEVITPAPTTPAVPELTNIPSTYTVERNDNLTKIAQKVYGDKKYWKNIYEANKDVIKSNYMIWANQVLVIPEL